MRRNGSAQDPDDAELQRVQLLVEHGRIGILVAEIVELRHLVLETHQRVVELRLDAETDEGLETVIVILVDENGVVIVGDVRFYSKTAPRPSRRKVRRGRRG